MESLRILLTGAGGFVGHHVLDHLLLRTGHKFVLPCSWQHRGEPRRILGLSSYQANRHRCHIFTHDLSVPFTDQQHEEILQDNIDVVLNIASDSHVDRSITHPVEFCQNNFNLALNLLEFARQAEPTMFLQFSTDEVYGPAYDINFPEWSPILPSNPYSASKAAQEALAISYWRTYGVPVVLTNTMNVFGLRQDREKYISQCFEKIRLGEQVSVHGSEGNIGSRHYIYAADVASAIHHIMSLPLTCYIDGVEECSRPDRYNIVGAEELDNLEVATRIARVLDKPLKYRFTDYHATRPGHDRRYALDGTKLAEAGWTPNWSFNEALTDMLKSVTEIL